MNIYGQESIIKHSDVNTRNIDSTYLKYQIQFDDLNKSRGINPAEGFYRTNEITSDKDFADLLGKLYPSNTGIAIIFYFFQNDTLKRVLFEPGKVIEVKYISITKDEILLWNTKINKSLNLYDLAENRSPILRGVKVNNPDPKKYDLNETIKDITDYLLPKSFDEKYKHLIVIPALSIGTIPFQLLRPYKNSSYLIEKCSFSIAPSITDLIALRTKVLLKTINSNYYPSSEATQFKDDSIALRVHFTFDNPLFVCNPIYPTNTKYFFPILSGAKREIDNAVKYSEKHILLEDSRATKKNVMHYLRSCDVAYFATHGISSDTSPMDSSFLVLGGNNDPFLSAKNIMDLRDSTKTKILKFPEMVILSACQTGLGKSMEAGVAGLARSFLIAGSNQVIMSLWSVDDNATAFLMERFIYHLQTPSLFLPSEQLRQAILDTRKKYPNPSQWASFSVFGIDY
ncbi:MAG: CHAT domain-containing protein [Ferruginibacter sp.]